MATTALTAGTFAETIENNEIVLVDWWADWCGPCKMFAPVFEKASDDNPDIVFAKIDTEAEQSLAAQAQISSIPTLMVFRDSILLFAQPGALPGAALDDLISQVRALNMDEVRAEIAKEQAGSQEA